MLECGLRAVVLHNKEVVWNYYAEFTTDCRRINTNTQKIVSHGYNQSAYVHLIANIGDRKSIELRPDERCECAWLIAEIYPRFDCAPHLFVATRDGGSTAIYGDAPTITKYPAGGEYVEGYVRVTFPGKWYHAIIIGSQLSKVTTVN